MKDKFFLKRTLSVLIFLKDLQAGHFQMNKSDDFDEVQDISSMSVGGVVHGHGRSWSLSGCSCSLGRSELCLLELVS